jgi:multiple sugar transport system permease protein
MIRRGRGWWTVASVLIGVWALLPTVWILSLSFTAPAELGAARGFLPVAPTWANYRAVFGTSLFVAALRNSVAIACLATSLAVGVATLAAWAVARLRAPGSRLLLAVALGIAMFPQAALVGPLFDVWRRTGLYDTWAGLVLPYLTFALPLAIWTLTASFRQLPWELADAAQLDGATRWQTLGHIVVPLAVSGLATTAILTFFFCWNDFLFAIALTSTDRARTVPAALAFFTGASQYQSPVTAIAAASVVVTIPVALLVLGFQRRIVAGLTAGAVKG